MTNLLLTNAQLIIHDQSVSSGRKSAIPLPLSAGYYSLRPGEKGTGRKEMMRSNPARKKIGSQPRLWFYALSAEG
jgi:hypothetical protein